VSTSPRFKVRRPSLQVAEPLQAAHAPDDWPIAAAMLQFPAADAHGVPATEQSSAQWASQLAAVAELGHTAVEVASTWVRIGDLSDARLEEFRAVLADVGLTVPGVGVVRESVLHPKRGLENLAFSHRMIDAAAALGAQVVCFGLHDRLEPAQQRSLWFWTVPGEQKPEDPRMRDVAVERYRELADHAASLGMEISLELYEDLYMGTVDEAVRFLQDVDHAAAGLNPDLGNLLRAQKLVDTWEYMVATALPHANYWHVKNYARLEDPANDTVLTYPTPLDVGTIDYRRAVKFAVDSGFNGPIVVEHYGGDGLAIGAHNEKYIRSLLPKG